ncbi:MAG: hypothetical protein WBC70_16805, partial [Candidatus Aminicenantales bacterium]
VPPKIKILLGESIKLTEEVHHIIMLSYISCSLALLMIVGADTFCWYFGQSRSRISLELLERIGISAFSIPLFSHCH